MYGVTRILYPQKLQNPKAAQNGVDMTKMKTEIYFLAPLTVKDKLENSKVGSMDEKNSCCSLVKLLRVSRRILHATLAETSKILSVDGEVDLAIRISDFNLTSCSTSIV